MKSKQLMKVNGTIGPGTNNMQANFDNIWIKSRPDTPYVARKKKHAAEEYKKAMAKAAQEEEVAANTGTNQQNKIPVADHQEFVSKEIEKIKY